MSLRFAERFADYLTKGEVYRLFIEVLVREYGSIAKASDAAGIERKTFYNWERAREVTRPTKVKVLRAAFEADPHHTLRFVVKILRRRAGEALFALLDYLRGEALRCEGREEFERYASLLRRALEEFGGPLSDEVAEELEAVDHVLMLKATKLGAVLRPSLYAEGELLAPAIEEEMPGAFIIVSAMTPVGRHPTSRGERREVAWTEAPLTAVETVPTASTISGSVLTITVKLGERG